MRRSSLMAALYLVLVFLSGALVGGFAHRLWVSSVSAGSVTPRSQEEYRRAYTEEMRSRLHLAPDQLSRLQQVLDATRERYRGFREKHKAELSAIQDDQTQKIRAFLTENQQAEYEKMREERSRRMGK